jgi:hypothetical protein
MPWSGSNSSSTVLGTTSKLVELGSMASWPPHLKPCTARRAYRVRCLPLHCRISLKQSPDSSTVERRVARKGLHCGHALDLGTDSSLCGYKLVRLICQGNPCCQLPQKQYVHGCHPPNQPHIKVLLIMMMYSDQWLDGWHVLSCTAHCRSDGLTCCEGETRQLTSQVTYTDAQHLQGPPKCSDI